MTKTFIIWPLPSFSGLQPAGIPAQQPVLAPSRSPSGSQFALFPCPGCPDVAPLHPGDLASPSPSITHFLLFGPWHFHPFSGKAVITVLFQLILCLPFLPCQVMSSVWTRIWLIHLCLSRALHKARHRGVTP